jgi:hypothetical protein
MLRRLALLAVVSVAAACTPGASPADDLVTTPPTTPGASLETTMPSLDPSASPDESAEPSESPEDSAEPSGSAAP